MFPAALPLRMRKPAPIHIRAHHHVAGIRSPFQQKAHAGAETIPWRETVCLPAVASLGRRGPGPGHWRRGNNPLARDGLSSCRRFAWKARSWSWALEASGGDRRRCSGLLPIVDGILRRELTLSFCTNISSLFGASMGEKCGQKSSARFVQFSEGLNLTESIKL